MPRRSSTPRAPFSGAWLDRQRRTLRDAWRGLRRSSGLTLAAVATLSVTIGASTAVFGVLNGLLWKSPSLAGAQLVRITQILDQRPAPLLLDAYRVYRDEAKSVSSLAAYAQAYMADGDAAREVDCAFVTDNFFDVAGVVPYAGRGFLSSDTSSAPVVVLGYGYWRRRFNADLHVIGRTLKLNGIALTIAGIAPAYWRAVQYGEPEVDAWIPATTADLARPAFRTGFSMIGRLNTEQSVETAHAEFAVLEQRMARRSASDRRTQSIEVAPISGTHDVDRRLPVLLLLGVNTLLVVGCINLAGLMIASALERRKEFATRLALGAPRRQLMVVSLLSSAIVTALALGPALLIAQALIRTLTTFYAVESEGVTPYFDFGVDARVLAFTGAVGLLAAMLTGFLSSLPAIRVGRPDGLLTERASVGDGRSWLRTSLLVAQVAASGVLAVTAGLMVASFSTVRSDHRDHVLFLRVKPNLARYTQARAEEYLTSARQRLASLSGVASVSLVQFSPAVPWDLGCGEPMTVVEATATGVSAPCVMRNTVTPEFFNTLKIPVVGGRGFNDADIATTPRVVVINEALGKRLWPTDTPIGHHVVFGNQAYEIVGVVRYLEYGRADGTERLYAFVPARVPGNRVLVRVAGDSGGMLRTLQRELTVMEPAVPVSEAMTFTTVIENTFMPVKVAAVTLGSASAVALLLCGIGLYGVVGSSVTRKTREIGIRVALGAVPGAVKRHIVAEGLWPVALGLLLSTAIAAASSKVLRSYLYGTSPTDWKSFVVAAASLLLIGALAAYVPARRAASLDPMRAVRSE